MRRMSQNSKNTIATTQIMNDGRLLNQGWISNQSLLRNSLHSASEILVQYQSC
uniref:Uncharacterized protein n=1 Tax=Ascaris lumbricoides TaxID=6252 RepID=A0A0M3HMS9_ASCLU